MRKLFLVAALCLALPAIARPAMAQARPDLSVEALSAWADSVYGEAIRTGRIDGAVVSIVVDGEPRFLSGYGYANTQTRTPVDPENTTFRLGSVSKTFAAVAIAQIQAKGRLPGLNEPISSFLGARAPLDETDTPITLRHLLTHSAGLDEQLFGLATFRQDEQTSPQPRIVRAPGTYTSYSNTGFGLLATAAERASGLSYADVLQQQIFTPLGMSGARLRTTIAPDNSLATGSYRAPDGTVWPMATDRMLRLDRAASGGVEASGRDMQSYMIALLDRGAEGKIPDLDASTFAPLFQEQARRHPAVNGFGMGFFLSDWNGMRVVEHGGVLPGARAYLHLIPEWNVGVFTAISGEPAGPPPLTNPAKWAYGPKAGQPALRLLSLSEMRAENLSMLLGPLVEPAHETTAGSAFEIAGTYAPERRNRTSIERALDLVRAEAFVRRIEALSPTKIRVDGREFDEIRPGVFWRKASGTGDTMGFYDTLVRLPGATRTEDAFTFVYNDMDFVRAGPADNIVLQKELLQLATLAGLSGLLFWLGGRSTRLSSIPALGMTAGGLSMFASLSAGFSQNQSPISDWGAGEVGRGVLLAASGNLFAASALGVVLVALYAAIRGPGGEGWIKIVRLSHHLLLSIAALGALFALSALQLIGWNAP